MAKRDIQFQSSTLKYEEDSYIKGSNGLYYFQFSTGTNRDLRQDLINYLAKKNGLDHLVDNNIEHKNIGDSFWGIFKKPEGMTYDEFITKVKSSKIGFIGQSPIIPTGRDYTRLDQNGNLLIATINSNLDNYQDCGNVLIDKDGNVIRAAQPSTIINACDERSGFYPVEIYKSKANKTTGAKEVYAREWNFLDPSGKILCDEYNFECHLGEEEIISVPRNFYMKDGKNVYTDWGLLPNAYVLCAGRQPKLYLSAVDVLIENRKKKAEGLAPIVEDERQYLEEYFLRKDKIENLFKELSDRLDSGSITQAIYNKIMNILDNECVMNDEFEENYKTENDQQLEDSICGQSM